jgi:hypothetical protein
MPQAIPIILAAAGASEAVVLVATVVVGIYESARAKQKAREAFEKSLSNRLVPVRSGIEERVYLLGAARLSGTVMYIEPIGGAKQSLDIVLAIANNECELVGWYMNEEFIPANSFPGDKYGQDRRKSVSDKFTNVTGPTATLVLDVSPVNPNAAPTAPNPIKVVFRAGSNKGTATVDSVAGATIHVSGLPAGQSTVTVTYDTSQGVSLEGVFLPGTAASSWFSWGADKESPGWDNTHQLKGICGTRTLFNWDEKDWESGPANVGASLIGKSPVGYPFYDPRTATNPAKTKNPALLAGWWMTLPRRMGGCGIPSDWIDWQAISAAANICDELVTVRNVSGGGYTTIKRYECDTVLSTGDSPLANLDKILSAMAGRRAFTGGLYKIVAGAFRPATLTISDADLIGDKPINAASGSSNEAPPNICSANFVDAFDNWREKPAPIVKNDAYITADGHEELLSITLPATTDPRRANYLQGVALEGSRPCHTVELYVGGIGENIAVFDCVQLNIATRSHLAGITFEVIEIEDFWDGSFCLRMAEIRTQTWALDPDKFTPTNPITPSDNSYLFNPTTVIGFAVAAITPQTLPDGSAIMSIDLTWDPIPDVGNTPSARIELRFRIAGGDWIGIAPVPADQVSTTITASLVDGEVYQFQARYVNGFGAASGWIDAWTQIDGTPLPAQLAVRLRADSTIFRVPATGNAVPLSINLAVIRTGLAAAATFTTNPPGITLGGSGDNRTLAYAAMGSNESVQITCTITQSSIDYVDVVTILKVHDGADANTTPDPTPPPLPTGLAVQSFVSHLFVTWDPPPAYTQGHGHDVTNVYAAPVPTGGPQPTFAIATPQGSSSSGGFVMAAEPGSTWAVWIRHQSKDGYLSPTAGGTNGVQQTAAKIGNINLGPLIVQAGNLVDGAVTGPKISAAALDATKFASTIQPVGIFTGAVPTTLSLRTLYRTDDGKLYKWNGTAYTAATPSTDITGQLTDAQIQAVAAAKLTGSITATQITDGAITTPKLAAGAVTAANIAADTITAGQIAAGAITASELGVNSVTAGAIAAGSIVAGKIAAGAVSANEIAAGAITASKIAITGRGAALNDDPAGIDSTAWIREYSGNAQFGVPNSLSPNGTCLRLTSTSSASADGVLSRLFPIVAGKRYRCSCWLRQVSGGGPAYFRLRQYDIGGNLVSYNLGLDGNTINSTFTRYSQAVDTAPTAVQAQFELIGSYNAIGVVDFADIRCEEVIPGELIVDGTITARKLVITGAGGALNDDPNTQDVTAWTNQGANSFIVATVTDTPGISKVLRTQGGSVYPFSRPIAFDPNKTYRMRCRARSVGADGLFYFTLGVQDSNGANIDHPGSSTYWVYSPSGISLPSSFTSYATKIGAGTPNPFPSNGRTMTIGALMNYNGTTGYQEITDVVLEEAIDSGLIVDGAIQATHLAANSIAVGTAAIQNGAIVNAMIGNAVIDSAKVIELTVSKISAGTLGADINVGAGKIKFDNGIVMKVEGIAFGTANQFIEWFGPRPAGGNINLCSESNATSYKTVTGDEYMGGTLSAGILKNAAQTTDTSITAAVLVGPFLTNGKTKTIVVSYQWQVTENANAGTGTITNNGSATVLLELSLNGGSSYTTLATLNATQTVAQVIVDGDPSVKDQIRGVVGGSMTITNNQGATNNMLLRARLTARTTPSVGGSGFTNVSITQFISVVSQENP